MLSIQGRLHRAFWVNFSKFFFRFFCSQDGFRTLREGKIAPSKPGTCMFALIFVPFDLLWLEEKCPFLCLYSTLYMGGYIWQFWVIFSKFFFHSLSTRDGFITILKDDLASFIPFTCIFALVFLAFGPFMAGRKMG